MPTDQPPQSQTHERDRQPVGSAVPSQPNQSNADRAAIRSLMANLPRDYRGARQRLTDLMHIFHEELAAAFQPILQAEILSMPNHTREDKRAIATWANGEVRHLGLVFGTESGQPAHLIADWAKKGRSKNGRFRFDLGYIGTSNRREGVYYDLPPVELMEEGPRQEPLAKWTDRVTGDDTKRQR